MRVPTASQELEYEVFGRFARDDRSDTFGLYDTRWLPVEELAGVAVGVVQNKIKEFRTAEAEEERRRFTELMEAVAARNEARQRSRPRQLLL